RCCLFFFTSRRRHTRLVSDWSSDVCSSDLRSSPAGSATTWVGAAGLDRGRPSVREVMHTIPGDLRAVISAGAGEPPRTPGGMDRKGEGPGGEEGEELGGGGRVVKKEEGQRR